MDNVISATVRKKYTGTAERILNFMGSGMKAEQSAEACGVTAGFVSQLWDESDFREQVELLRLKGVSDGIDIDNNYYQTEKLLAKRLHSMASTITDPDKMLRVLKYVNEAKKKVPIGNTDLHDESNPMKVVKLVLPPILQQTFILNPNKEVIEIDGQNLITMTPTGLKELVNRRLPAPEKGIKNAIEQL